jgi:hypothetical protein
VNPLTGAPVHLYVESGRVRAEFEAPLEDPAAKDDLLYTVAVFEPHQFFTISPHNHTCQSNPDSLTSKNVEEYLADLGVYSAEKVPGTPSHRAALPVSTAGYRVVVVVEKLRQFFCGDV